jgi:uncharacterized protein YlxW (UPF0749 family)
MAARSRSGGRSVPGRSRHARRSPAGTVGQFLVLVLAGLLFVTSAKTANGTELRNDRGDAATLLRAVQGRYEAEAKQAAALQHEVETLTAQAGSGDSAVDALQQRSQGLLVAAGMKAMRGPGLTVTLDDAPRTGNLPSGARPDDLVVHQQDVQAVVNALWAGGADAIELMDQRVISTSAVRCVGNTLILQGRVYSPPYRVTAIGNVASMQRALADSPEVGLYQEYVQAVGLGWSVVPHGGVTVPAYTGSLELRYARAPSTGGSSASPTGAVPLESGTGTGAGSGSHRP